MSEGVSGAGANPPYRVFNERPLPTLCREVEAHVAKTGQPETFPGIFTGDLKKDEPFAKLLELRIDRLKRPDGDRAPCPMCHSPNKFIEGWLVYLERLHAIAVIGTECASKDTRTSADRDWRERQSQLTEEAYLEAIIPQLGSWLAILDRVGTVVTETDSLLRGFRSKGKSFFKALAPARTASGLLVVTQEVKRRVGGPRAMRTSGSTVETRDIPLGRIRGLKALDPRFSPERAEEAVRDLILPHVRTSEEAMVDYITGPAMQRKTAYRELRKAEDSLQTLLVDLEDCRSFFTDDNIAVIAEWARHPDGQHRFELRVTPTENGKRLLFYRPGDFWNPLLRPALWEPLPSFQAIIN
jgi:hypothetical protein